jgi:hypothetical protein
MSNHSLIDQIRRKMEEKDTEELVAIWQKDDKEEWTEDAFEAIRQVLTARGEVLPERQQEKTEEAPKNDQARLGTCENCGKEAEGTYYPIFIGIRKDDNAYNHRVVGKEKVFICDDCVLRKTHIGSGILGTVLFTPLILIFGTMGAAAFFQGFIQDKNISGLIAALLLFGVTALPALGLKSVWNKKNNQITVSTGSWIGKKAKQKALRKKGYIVWDAHQYDGLVGGIGLKYEPSPDFLPFEKKITYIVLLYSSTPPTIQEQNELINGLTEQEGMPVKILETVKVDSMPTGPDDYVVATCLLACDKHKIKFYNNRDEIAFRSGMGLGIATIRMKA